MKQDTTLRDKNILVATDFSSASKEALQFGLWVQHAFGSSIHLVHVTPNEIESLGEIKSQEDAREELLRRLRSFSTNYPGVRNVIPEHANKINFRIEKGKVVERIISAAEQLQAHLIIIGSRKERNILEYLFGSVGTQLIYASPFPILVVPENSRQLLVSNILLATLPQQDVEQDVKTLQTVLPSIGINYIHNVFINTFEQRGKKVTEETIKLGPDLNTPATMIRAASVKEGIDYFKSKYHIDLIALKVPSRSRTEQLLHKSVSQSLIYQEDIPVLILK